MIGVKDYDTNTLWRLSDKVYRETDLEDLNGKINLGDVIVIMTVDREYRLPRYEVSLGGD
jgi:hypothetical protein